MRPMLCKSAPTGADGLPVFPPDPENWIMEMKADGWRFTATVTDHGVSWVGGRNGRTYFSRALDAAAAALRALPVGTTLDGEILAYTREHHEKLPSTSVSTILASPSKGALDFYAFDVVSVGDSSTTHLCLSDRKVILSTLRPLNESVVIVPGEAPSWSTYQTWLNLGAEGVILKHRDSRYLPGRQKSWIKLKPQATCDAVILRLVPGQGDSNRDRFGAFDVVLEDGTETSVKIPDDKTVEYCAKHPRAMLGRKIEIRHHGIMESGKPRHPVMVRTREDME